MIIDCISDLHGHYPKLEGGDLLIMAGDCTNNDSDKSWIDFECWFISQKYKQKILVSGNHDNFLQSIPEHNMWKHWDKLNASIHYLCDSEMEFGGLKVWGSPWTLRFPGMNPRCMAFTVDTEEELAEKWKLIPDDVDILVTHSPSFAILDKTIDNRFVGSTSLASRCRDLNNLKLHIFGHIHESYGKIDHRGYLPSYVDVSRYCPVNASHVNENYEPVNKPIRIEI